MAPLAELPARWFSAKPDAPRLEIIAVTDRRYSWTFKEMSTY